MPFGTVMEMVIIKDGWGRVLYTDDSRESTSDEGELSLEGADLSGKWLGGANLEYANLEGANLRSAKLDGADLGSTNLKGAVLEGASCVGTLFDDANLDNVKAK